MTMRDQLNSFKRQAGAWWTQRSGRERLLLLACSAVIIVSLAWMLILRPALDTIAQSRELLPRLHAEAAQVQALIQETQALQRNQSGRIDPVELPRTLRASLRRAGLEASATLSETAGLAAGDGTTRQWEFTLHNANALQVMEWLSGLPHLAQLRTTMVELVRATVDGRDRPGHVSGRILVQQPERRTR
ncbi:MAG: type II secretion system protein GspM [Candidimonas sp.]